MAATDLWRTGELLSVTRTNGLLRRKYVRAVPPGVLGGLAAGLIEVPHLLTTGATARAGWQAVLLSFAATIVVSCLLGSILGLLFEAFFHLLLGVEAPGPVSEFSIQACQRRREALAHGLVGVVAVIGLTCTTMALAPLVSRIFANSFASAFLLAVPSGVMWLLVHIRLTGLVLRLFSRASSLRRSIFVGAVVVVVVSYAVALRLFGGMAELPRAVLSFELGLFVFGAAWLFPRRWTNQVGVAGGGAVIVLGTVFALHGLSYPVKTLLFRSQGFAENLALRLSLPRAVVGPGRLRQAIAFATDQEGGSRPAEPQGAFSLDVTPSAGKKRPDIVLITVDSLRPDRLGCYGSRSGLTPHLDEFASGASIFRNAFTAAPMTTPSMDQVMSGQLLHTLPTRFVPSKAPAVVNPSSGSVASELRAAGYRTVGVLGWPLMTRSPFVGQGFSTLEGAHEGQRGLPQHVILNHILDDLARETAQPLFVWGHVMEVHDWQEEGIRSGEDRTGVYDGRVSATDKEFGRFFAELAKTERGRNAVVIITADHGEALGEQGLFFHGLMSPVTLRIPLLVRFPGAEVRSVDTTVSLLDLAPTILAAAGMTKPGLFGVDLMKIPPGPSTKTWPGRVAFHEQAIRTNRLQAYTVGVTALPWQLSYFPRYDLLSLVNLEQDPAGEDNLAGRNLPQENILIDLLVEMLEKTVPAPLARATD